MIRDYKFQRTQWEIRKRRRFPVRAVLLVVATLGLGAAGYVLYDHVDPPTLGFGSHAKSDSGESSQIIPLPLPPH